MFSARYIYKFEYIILVLFLLFTSSYDVKDRIVITIERQLIKDECIQGYIFVDSVPIGYTLELPWKNNQVGESSIPKGTYKGILRYDKSDGWRIQLEDVPNRTGVQIHIGNYTSQTQGCTLVGMSIDVENCSIYRSKEAYVKLKESFYGTTNPVQSPNKNIQVIYR